MSNESKCILPPKVTVTLNDEQNKFMLDLFNKKLEDALSVFPPDLLIEYHINFIATKTWLQLCVAGEVKIPFSILVEYP